MKAKVVLYIIIFVLNISVFAQNPEWIVYDTSNSGLTNNTILSLDIDNDGKKWVGTYNELASFFNNNWTVFDATNSIIYLDAILSIYADNYDNIWLGEYQFGMDQYAGFIKYNPNAPLGFQWVIYNDYVILDIESDNNDNIWITTRYNGLVKFDGTTSWTIYNLSSLGLNTDWWNMPIALDDSNNIWIGTFDGLVKFDGDTSWTIYNESNSGIAGNEVISIAIDNSNHIWAGTKFNGLSYFDGSNWIVYDTLNSLLPSNFVRTLTVDNNNYIWIGASGLVKFDGINWQVFNTTNSGLPHNSVSGIVIDSLDNKWIGTGGGLVVYKEGGVVSVDQNILAKNNSAILYPVYPNPVNYSTVFRYYLPEKSDISLKIFDLQGKEIAVLVYEKKLQGEHTILFNVNGLRGGIYVYQLQTNNYIETKKMVIIK